jgi:predicted peptidase
MRRFLVFLPLLAACSGCPVWQSQDVPVPATLEKEQTTGAEYWRYVPKDYSTDRDWPMVVTLHGTIPYDTPKTQINEWKRLAEDKQFIVVAPRLASTQGILPVISSRWFKDIERDEKVILAVIDEMCKNYRIDKNSIMLHAFSAGGFPLYYTGLRNAGRFNALVARGCNCRTDLLEQIKITPEARKLPMLILWGKDDNILVQNQSWMAFRFLRENGCFEAQKKEFMGGHLRRPDLAYDFWAKYLPERHRR